MRDRERLVSSLWEQSYACAFSSRFLTRISHTFQSPTIVRNLFRSLRRSCAESVHYRFPVALTVTVNFNCSCLRKAIEHLVLPTCASMLWLQ